MQQRHRNLTAMSNLTRTNQLRSRSVTSSPNHMLDRMMSGYMTDTQRARPTSPDTMSEYGGQRRRKRLPEPPTNVVPITPSMVRKMVQANRVASTNSERIFNMKMGTTMLPSSFGRIPPYQSFLDKRLSLASDYKPSINLGATGYMNSCLTSDRPSTSSGIQSTQLSSGYHRFSLDGTSSGSTYKPAYNMNEENSILEAAQISDVKETPELDKLISNLDEYYSLDGAINKQTGAFRPTTSYRPHGSSFESMSLAQLRPSFSSNPRASDYPLTSTSTTTHYPKSPSHLPNTSYRSMTRQNSELARHPSHSSYDQTYYRQGSFDERLNALESGSNQIPNASDSSLNYLPSTSQMTTQYRSVQHPQVNNFGGTTTSSGYVGGLHQADRSRISADHQSTPYEYTNRSISPMRTPSTYTGPPFNNHTFYNHSGNLLVSNNKNQPRYNGGYQQPIYGSDYNQMSNVSEALTNNHGSRLDNRTDRVSNSFAPITKDDIINNGPKYNSIGYRFRTENQNKYVNEQRTPIECLQSRYPYPYKRILLSKNPKDRLGNGIGVRIVGGYPMPNIYDKVNKCIVNSGAFVTEVFQSSRVYFMDEMHEGDQIIEWNGVNLCNRSDGEVQQILFSQFSDDEVEIIYLSKHKFKDAYGMDLRIDTQMACQDYDYVTSNGSFEAFSGMNKPNNYNMHGHYVNEPFKRSIRRKLSLSSISHMWSK